MIYDGQFDVWYKDWFEELETKEILRRRNQHQITLWFHDENFAQKHANLKTFISTNSLIYDGQFDVWYKAWFEELETKQILRWKNCALNEKCDRTKSTSQLRIQAQIFLQNQTDWLTTVSLTCVWGNNSKKWLSYSVSWNPSILFAFKLLIELKKNDCMEF